MDENVCRYDLYKIYKLFSDKSCAEVQHLIDTFDFLFSSLDINVYIIQNGRFQYFNTQFEKVTGYSKEELLNTPPLCLVYPEDRHNLRVSSINSLKYNSLYQMEYRIVRKSGEIIWVSENGVCIQYNGGKAIFGTFRNINRIKHIEQRFLEKSDELESKVKERTAELAKANEELKESLSSLQKKMNETINALASTVEMRDLYTAGHQRRVAGLAKAIAEEMGLAEEQVMGVYLSAAVHDIGKIYIPSEILSKPSTLTDIEFALIKNHPKVGYDILKEIEFPWPIAQIVFQHQERINGTGYPFGLKGNEILTEAKIIAVADVVDAMAAHRPYRSALGIEKALEELQENKGELYDPAAADACLRLFNEKGFRF